MKRTLRFLLLCLLAAGIRVASAQPALPADADAPEVRNLIFMIGDGMGLGQVALLKIEEGYRPTAFDRAQNVALISTYSANNRVTDSAAAGTALATGHKTNNSMLGMTPDSAVVQSMIARAVGDGRPAGIVVTCALQHATPGAFYAHAGNRKMTDLISEQFLSSGIDVALGGGRAAFERQRPEGGSYVDAMRREGYAVVEKLDALDGIDRGRVVGLFADEHLLPAKEGRGDYLPRAVKGALRILTNDAESAGEGFVLMVEGSQIDFESHGNDAKGILSEMRDFDRAVAEAMDYADRHPGTLVVVTADHETGGLTMPSGKKDFTLSDSGIEYRFGTTSHTGILVPVYLYGTGAERINGILDNTELADRLMRLLGLN